MALPETSKISLEVISTHRKISLHQFVDDSPAAHAAETQAPSLPSPENLDVAQVDDNNQRGCSLHYLYENESQHKSKQQTQQDVSLI
jgi:hypothetical protein